MKINEVNLDNIKNRNETRVKNKIPEVLAEFPDYKPDRLDIQDIYALALNLLPSRYRQRSSIILQEPVKDDDILEAIRHAIRTVKNNPHY